MNVLVVDDDPISVELIKRHLTAIGEVDVAYSGNQAVDAVIKGFDDGRSYGLITLDILMPGIDGFQTLELIREIEQSRKIESSKEAKIIIITSISNPENGKYVIEENCDGYITKPITKVKITRQLEKLQLIPATLGNQS